MTDVAQIVAGLTKAQREALLTRGNTPADDLARDKPGIARQLHDKGLTFIDLSPLGYRVRTALLSKEGESADA